MRALLGSGAILFAAVYVLVSEHRRQAARQALVWALRQALEDMETAIRWEKKPLPALLSSLKDRPFCDVYFSEIENGLQGGIPLHTAWNNAFARLQDREMADILCRVTLGGDSERLQAALKRGGEELERLYRWRQELDRQQRRVRGAAVVSVSCLVIILLL